MVPVSTSRKFDGPVSVERDKQQDGSQSGNGLSINQTLVAPWLQPNEGGIGEDVFATCVLTLLDPPDLARLRLSCKSGMRLAEDFYPWLSIAHRKGLPHGK